jgi:hypothetical protein
MHDEVSSHERGWPELAGPNALQHRLTRRGLLKSVGGLGLGAVGLGLSGGSAAALEHAWGNAWGNGWRRAHPAATYDAGVVTEWARLFLALFRTSPSFSILPATRAYAYLGVTLYEALLPGMPGSISLAGRVTGLTAVPGPQDAAYHWPTVANHALAEGAREFFRMTTDDNKAAIDALEATLAERLTYYVPQGIARRSAARGYRVAQHVIAWAKADGGHDGHLTNFPADYIPPAGPGLWVPTPPAHLSAYQPYWGSNRPFVLTSAAAVDPGPPPEFSTDPGSSQYLDAVEVWSTVNNLTEEERAIALFWADPLGPTVGAPGHWLSIMTQVIDGQSANLALAAETFAKAGLAVADALIACYYTKYRYNLLRPITYIQRHIDAAWGSQMPATTPPFPEYSSAHSVGTRAFAQVIYDLYGDFPFTDHTHDSIGLAARSYTSWFGMAEETGISRLYAGIHFRTAIERGLVQGRLIGEQVGAL